MECSRWSRLTSYNSAAQACSSSPTTDLGNVFANQQRVAKASKMPESLSQSKGSFCCVIGSFAGTLNDLHLMYFQLLKKLTEFLHSNSYLWQCFLTSLSYTEGSNGC
jgi:hypothetical protein